MPGPGPGGEGRGGEGGFASRIEINLVVSSVRLGNTMHTLITITDQISLNIRLLTYSFLTSFYWLER